MTANSAEPGQGPPLGDDPDLSGPDPGVVFGRLFDDHAGSLHAYLARRVGDQTADDLVSETFLVALQRRHTYDPTRAGVRPWLYGIAGNLLRRHVRQEVRGWQARARMVGADRVQAESPEVRTSERVTAQQQVRQLAGALAALEPGDRDVLLLTSWGRLSSTEVAQALGIPVGTVHSRLHRVRRWLRSHSPVATSGMEDGDA
ncbi:RNA polymerase sigma-70 factor (ECF subfamily) [Saccharothrix tamanrassetensis]|uniref:RNA polymerase sigma-70 factor (ECF subfamily) n=1 Tax=Saccharothrix tamanrassetensis TaxID=1051531 RepID=A0A841C7U7_9PSEU|nr:sigma-70 family RNA polymerase sigma factor [Saccharothrix tamanrassetensis]MBB5953479.1 RNA polymerase sigma-70 factor (ECF subfamily) [Saccharothrix tamanrassetensis]